MLGYFLSSWMGQIYAFLKGLGSGQAGIFNNFGFKRLLKFCSFANPGKKPRPFNKRLLTISYNLINLSLYIV
jgi:hypothetical protein